MAEQQRPRLWRYEVDEVYGDAPVTVGQVLVDKWKADRTWSIYNFSRKGDPYVGGWHAKLLGEATPDIAQQVYDHWEEAKNRAANDVTAAAREYIESRRV